MLCEKEWEERNKLRAEGYKLCSDGNKLRAEGDKLLAEDYKLCSDGNKLYAKGYKLRAEGYKLCSDGNKLYAKGYKLYAEGDIIFFTAICEKYGNTATVELHEDSITINGMDTYTTKEK